MIVGSSKTSKLDSFDEYTGSNNVSRHDKQEYLLNSQSDNPAFCFVTQLDAM